MHKNPWTTAKTLAGARKGNMEPPPFSPDLLKPVNTYQLHKELQKIEGLERLKESEVRTPTFKIKLQVFTALLELNCISTCADLMSSREQERLKEKRAGKSLEQRRMSEHAFRRIFSKVVSKVIKRMKEKTIALPPCNN